MKDTSIWTLGLIAVLLCSLLLQLQAARGTFWRGRDCHDWDGRSYPGRQPYRGDETADYNCNGIWGVDRVTGKPWEDILCRDFDSRGIIYIGDSVGDTFTNVSLNYGCDNFEPQKVRIIKLLTMVRSIRWKNSFFVHFQVHPLME